MTRTFILPTAIVALSIFINCQHWNWLNNSYDCDIGKTSSTITLQPGPGEAQDCNTHYSYDRIAGSTWQEYNNGLNSIFGVGVYDPNTVIRALIRFELPDSINQNELQSAKLVLHTNKWIRKEINDPIQINVHKMLRSWKQGNFNGGFYEKGRNNSTIDGVTAMERFYGNQDGSEKWSIPGIGMNDIDASVKIYTSDAKGFGDTTAWEFDLTSLVREWLSNRDNNFGILLRSPTDQSINDDNYSYPDIWSGDNTAEPKMRPSLVLEIKK